MNLELDQDVIRILIADDEPLIRMDLKEMIEEDFSYKVVAEGKDGAEAVELAQEINPDIIFLDIMMPNKTGIEAAREINENLKRRVPIIMLTAYSQRELIEEASEAGVFAYLTKPLRKTDLVPAIEVAISRALEFEDLSDEIKSLKGKIESRKLVEKAKGIIMKETGMTEPEAYRHLQKRAMDERSSLKAVAESVLQAA